MMSLVEVDIATKRDVMWWRIIIITSLKNPDFFSARISHLRINMKEDITLYSDASSEIGAGAWLTFGNEEVYKKGFIRWTSEELYMFRKQKLTMVNNDETGVSINVLEFFAVVYFVLIWRHELKGYIVRTNCDNSATVSWLARMRACGKSPVSEALMKLFALVCLKFDIRIISFHLPGIFNVYADFLSRDVFLQELPSVIEDIGERHWWRGQSAEVISRNFLLRCIIQPSTLPSNDLLNLLETLQ